MTSNFSDSLLYHCLDGGLRSKLVIAMCGGYPFKSVKNGALESLSKEIVNTGGLDFFAYILHNKFRLYFTCL